MYYRFCFRFKEHSGRVIIIIIIIIIRMWSSVHGFAYAYIDLAWPHTTRIEYNIDFD